MSTIYKTKVELESIEVETIVRFIQDRINNLERHLNNYTSPVVKLRIKDRILFYKIIVGKLENSPREDKC